MLAVINPRDSIEEMCSISQLPTRRVLQRGGSMRIAVAALICLLPTIGAAGTVSIGDAAVAIPSPEGFVAVTQNMAALYEFQKQFVGPTSEELVAFIPEGDVPAALKDEIPDFSRRFSAQISKKNANVTASSSDFANLKRFAKSQYEELVKKVEKSLPGLVADRNAAITKKYGAEFAVSALGMVPLAFHEESDRTLAYSAFVKGTTNDAAGRAAPHIGVVTTTLVLVNGKVLHLYCFGDDGDLEWSREASKRWASAIIAANPADLAPSVKESLPSARKPFNWEEIGVNSIKGALIALVIGLIGWARTRRKTS